VLRDSGRAYRIKLKRSASRRHLPLRGDVFALAALAAIVALVAVFVLFPLAEILATGFRTPRGAWAPELFWKRLSATSLWVTGGIVWNTLLLGL
jgi:hypothetical protein